MAGETAGGAGRHDEVEVGHEIPAVAVGAAGLSVATGLAGATQFTHPSPTTLMLGRE